MRYIDTGSRTPDQALGSWLRDQFTPNDVRALRWQSGFFAADALGLFAPTLTRLAGRGETVAALVGSNDRATLGGDVLELARLIGVPRATGQLAVVSFAGAFFHPKAYHIVRMDGSQCAYVGSANLTTSGLTGLHVEAGIVLDTRDGDREEVLAFIETAIDSWFLPRREGVYVIDNEQTVETLVQMGILAAATQPRPGPSQGSGAGASAGSGGPRLQPLIALPAFTVPPREAAERQEAVAMVSEQPPVPRDGFPPYLLFDPGIDEPTSGLGALSGSSLPHGASGLVLRLNRDSARHFTGTPGTANISVPVATLGTLKFGIYHGRYERPRAEYTIRMRYVGRDTFWTEPTATNVMAYGFARGETGHGDVRLVVPAGARALAALAENAGLPVPTDGDFALLEWPSEETPEFRLTFMERGSALFEAARRLFERAAASGQLVGDGACWLPPRLSPPWGR